MKYEDGERDGEAQAYASYSVLYPPSKIKFMDLIPSTCPCPYQRMSPHRVAAWLWESPFEPPLTGLLAK